MQGAEERTIQTQTRHRSTETLRNSYIRPAEIWTDNVAAQLDL
jgi:hypothetical protein